MVDDHGLVTLLLVTVLAAHYLGDAGGGGGGAGEDGVGLALLDWSGEDRGHET